MFLEPKLGLPRVPQPGQPLEKEMIFSAKALNGFLEDIVAYPFGSTKWMDKVTLRCLILGPLNKDEENIKLKDVVGYVGWNLEHLSFSFPASILLEMEGNSPLLLLPS